MSTSTQPAATQTPLTATAALTEIQDLVGRAHDLAGAISTERVLAILARVPGHWVECQDSEAGDRYQRWRFNTGD